MTAIDELRRLLDERGVEWDYGITGVASTRFRASGGVELTFVDLRDGVVCTTILTPEQAIAATLGDETCKADETETWTCERVGRQLTVHVMECSACGGTYEHVNGDYEFCPRCGAKVVDE